MAVSMHINKEHDGIELRFPDSERPSAAVRTALKEQGFRWHHTGKYWFARKTDERLNFARKLIGEQKREVPAQKEPVKKAEKPSKGRKAENTFAAVYDSIGGREIRDSSEISLHDIPSSGVYCKDTNAFFRHTWGLDDVITVVDLTNAGKNGLSCPTWKLYPLEQKGITSNFLVNEEKLKTCSELLAALRSGKTLESVKMYAREDKGVETFSPFVEAKPLTKMPERWNKRNFTNAVLSGQIYMGHVDYHYTDDYAMDAAYDFGKGAGINIPVFALEVVEGWTSTNYVRMESVGEDQKTCTIGFSEHSNSGKTFYFDLSCDIREGKRRADEKAAGIRSYNDMMKASCVKLPPESIDENKIYSVTSLDMNGNTGIYGTKTNLMQGSALKEHCSEDWSCLEVLSANDQEIIPDKLYDVASFYHPREYADPDDRIIDCGNRLQLVTGKALLELTAEGICLPHIQEATGEHRTIESDRENLKQFIRGDKHFMFTGLQESGYQVALDKLNREAARAGHREQGRSGLNDLIAAAQKKAGTQSRPGEERPKDFSR